MGVQINKFVENGRGIRSEEAEGVKQEKKKRLRGFFYFFKFFLGGAGSKMLTPGCWLAAYRRRI